VEEKRVIHVKREQSVTHRHSLASKECVGQLRDSCVSCFTTEGRAKALCELG
jgi:hypothetical protein